jgi:hypothetical protein
LIGAYNPYSGFTSLGTQPIGNLETVMQMSQRPHVYLDPTTCTGGELIVPFFHRYNAIDLIQEEAPGMGALHTYIVYTLAHANGATEGCTVVVSAWMDEVSLCVPTTATPGYTLQAGNEYSGGIISAPASALASMATCAANVPVIGPFARATAIGASAISGIASIFGFSKPVNLNPVEQVHISNFGVLANTAGLDSCEKLTVDAKQELSIDPRTVGLGDVDELSISNIASREGIIGIAGWESTDGEDVILMQVRVAPSFFSVGERRQPSPCMFAAAPFQYWRGTLIFRFQIVASTLHKGRLRISWDPYYHDQTDSTQDMNTRFTRIVDLSVDRDFEVPVAWNRHFSYNLVPSYSDNAGFVGNVDLIPNTTTDNGMLQVAVFNKLVTISNSDTSHPAIVVSMRAGDDFEVAAPHDDISFTSIYPPLLEAEFQAGTEETEPAETLLPQSLTGGEDASAAPQGTADELTPIGDPITDASINLVYFGERIASFRTLLKRYNFYRVNGFSNSVANLAFKIDINNFPLYRGFAPTGANLDHDVGGHPYNYVKTTLLTYLAPAFAGYRGGMRWKHQFNAGAGTTNGHLSVVRKTAVAFSGFAAMDLNDTSGNFNLAAVNFLSGTHPGAAVSDLRNCTVVNVELPWYSRGRFTTPRDVHKFPYDIASGNRLAHRIEGTTTNFDSSGENMRWITSYVAVGEDFNFFFFVNAPTVYFYGDPLPQITPPVLKK